MVGHGHVLVNGRRVNIPSFKVEKGMSVSIRPESRGSALYVNRTEVMADTKAPGWMTFEDQGFAIAVAEHPSVGEGEAPFSASVIIQFYSR
jgi:small subunit ribosomal protein S4